MSFLPPSARDPSWNNFGVSNPTSPLSPSHSDQHPAIATRPVQHLHCRQKDGKTAKMSDDEEISVYDEVEIEDMTYDETLQTYHYPCPCGDRFEIALLDLQDESNDIAVCPSCSLMIRVIYEVVSKKRPARHPPPRRRCIVASRAGSTSCIASLCAVGLTLCFPLRNRIISPSPTSQNPTRPPTRPRRKSPSPPEGHALRLRLGARRGLHHEHTAGGDKGCQPDWS